MIDARRSTDLPEDQQVVLVDVIKDEGVGGTLSLADRPDGFRLIRMVQDGLVDEVWITRLDRVARSLRVLLDTHDFLEQHEVTLHAIYDNCDTSTHTGKLVFHILGAIAEWERERIAERTATGRHARAAQGRCLQGSPKFGFRTDPHGYLIVDDRLIEAVQMTAEQIVREMFERIALRGESAYAVAGYLTAQGVPLTLNEGYRDRMRKDGRPRSRGDGKWTVNRVTSIIHDPIFKGEGVSRPNDGREIPFTAPAIVSPEVWERAQAQLTRNRELSRRKAQVPYLLGGLIKCGDARAGQVCGLTYRGFTVRRTPARAYRYYGAMPDHYVGPSRDRNCLCRLTIKAEEIERAVWAKVYAIIRDPREAFAKAQAQLDARRQDGASKETQLRAIRERLHELEQERQRVLTTFEKGHRSEAETDARLADIVRDVARLQHERGLLESQISLTDALEARLASAGAALRAYQDKVDEIDRTDNADRKRAIIVRLVPEISVTHPDGTRDSRKIRMAVDLGDVFQFELADG